MKDRRTRLVAVIALVALAIGLGIFALLQRNNATTPPGMPTAQAAKTTPTAVAFAPTPTPLAPDWSIFHGRYFTMQIPPSWESMTRDSYALYDVGHDPPLSSEVEAEEWRVSPVDGTYADVRVRYEPYAELLSASDSTTFQAGDLTGVARTWTYTDTGFTNIEILLPGTPSNSGPICYEAFLGIPTSMPKDQQDLISRQFKDTVASLAPSQEALQSTPTAIPAPYGVQTCSAENLTPSVDGQGCTGFFCGIITLKNTGQTECSVHGRPIMKYIAHDGESLPISQVSVPPVSGNVDSEIVLKPGGIARMIYRTSTYGCSFQDFVPITAAWVMELPGMSAPITLRGEATFDICDKFLPSVAWYEVGTFDADK